MGDGAVGNDSVGTALARLAVSRLESHVKFIKLHALHPD